MKYNKLGRAKMMRISSPALSFRILALIRVNIAVEQFSDRIHVDTSFKHNRIPQKKEKSRLFSGYLWFSVANFEQHCCSVFTIHYVYSKNGVCYRQIWIWLLPPRQNGLSLTNCDKRPTPRKQIDRVLTLLFSTSRTQGDTRRNGVLTSLFT